MNFVIIWNLPMELSVTEKNESEELKPKQMLSSLDGQLKKLQKETSATFTALIASQSLFRSEKRAPIS